MKPLITAILLALSFQTELAFADEGPSKAGTKQTVEIGVTVDSGLLIGFATPGLFGSRTAIYMRGNLAPTVDEGESSVSRLGFGLVAGGTDYKIRFGIMGSQDTSVADVHLGQGEFTEQKWTDNMGIDVGLDMRMSKAVSLNMGYMSFGMDELDLAPGEIYIDDTIYVSIGFGW